MSKKERYSQFEFITYPESMGDIYNQIEELCLTCIRSPLHNADVNKKTGELKKPHYHNMIIWSSLHSEEQIDDICKQLNILHWEKVYDKRLKLRYYCHLDSPNKAKYDVTDVLVIGNFNYNSVLDKEELPNPHRAFIDYISRIDVDNFRALVNKVNSERPEFLKLLIDKSYFYYQYARKDQ